jgi:phosphate-selective porin OprO/OprP
MMNSRKTFKQLVVISSMMPLSLMTLAKDDVKMSGYVMIDYDNFDSSFVERGDQDNSQADIRRARLALKSELAPNWKSKLQLDFSGDQAQLKDAYIRYKGWDWANITIGKQKEPFGLENQISSRNLAMIERSIVSEAFSPGRSLGVQLTGDVEQVNWQLGVFQPDNSGENTAITGRITWRAFQDNDQYFHVGASFSQRDYSDYDFRVNETLEVNFADSLFEGDKLILNKASLHGVEAIWSVGGFAATAEWQQAQLTDQSLISHDYQGGYVQLSYFLSGVGREYDQGVLDQPLKTGWELTSRYSQFDMQRENKQAKIYSVGVNYHVNPQIKLMADVIKAQQYVDNQLADDGKAVSLRVQYSF